MQPALDDKQNTQEDVANHAENSIASLVAEIFAHQAIQKSILSRTMQLGCAENSKLSKEELASEIIAYLETPDTVERHEEKILLDLVYDRIVLRKKYSKMIKLLLFFALYSTALLIRSDGASSYEIESRYRIAFRKPVQAWLQRRPSATPRLACALSPPPAAASSTAASCPPSRSTAPAPPS